MNTPRAPAAHFTVLYFASASSYVSKASGGYDFLAAPVRVTEVFDLLESKYPGFKKSVLDSCLLSVNDEYVDLDEELAKGEAGMQVVAGDIVVIIPPVSAG